MLSKVSHFPLLGVKKRLGHAQIGLLLGFNSKFPTSIPTPFMYGVPPGCLYKSPKLFDIFFVSPKEHFVQRKRHDFCTELKTAISSLDFQKSPSSLRGLKSSLRSLRNSWGWLVASLYSRNIGSYKSMSKLRLHWEKKLAQFGVL